MECERGMACFVQMPVWYIRHARLWFAETFLSFKRCKQRQTFLPVLPEWACRCSLAYTWRDDPPPPSFPSSHATNLCLTPFPVSHILLWNK